MSNKTCWYNSTWNCCSLAAILIGVINFFLILLLWNVIGKAPEVSTLAVSVTVFQTLLAVTAIGGFFLLRGAAIRAAEEEARSEFSKHILSMQGELREKAEAVAIRATLEYLSTPGVRGGKSAIQNDTVEIMHQLEGSNPDGQNA